MNILFSVNQNISSSGIVTVYLLVIVFAVLAFLVVVLSVGRRLMAMLQSRFAAFMEAKAAKKAAKEAAKQLPEAAPQAVIAQESEDSAEVVAAITAAITMMLQVEAPQKKAKFVVRKIERL